MAQGLRFLAILVGVMAGQLYLAPTLRIGSIRPDFILIFLVFFSARFGRVPGILLGFGVGFLQDLTGSLSVLGTNALVKSIVGYSLGTLNGNLAVWTPRVINLYIYGSLVGHALLYQLMMVQGLETPWNILVNNVLLEAFISSILITGMRYMVPLMQSGV